MKTVASRDYLKRAVMVALAAMTIAAAHSAQRQRPPNIILILADDVGIDRIPSYGFDTYRTPNIDALVKGGMRFEYCYAMPLCAPSRSALITGRYGFRTGGLTNETGRNPQPDQETSFARVLKGAGYATCQAGKWRHTCATPTDWGFNEYITDPTAGGWFWQKSYTKNGKEIRTETEIYFPAVAHEFALDFVRQNRDKPFFLYYATHLGHNPHERTPDSAPDSKDFYGDNYAYLDKVVGSIVAEIDKLNLKEQTLILFAGDNGTPMENRNKNGRMVHGHKGLMLEGGARVPLIARWSGVTPANTVCSNLVDFSDFFVTFADIANAALPSGFVLDGHSFAAPLRGQIGTPREWVFVQLGSKWYVREHGWKLNESGELFDMKEAPFGETLVAAEAPNPEAKVARERLQRALNALNPAAGKTAQTENQKKQAERTGQAAKSRL